MVWLFWWALTATAAAWVFFGLWLHAREWSKHWRERSARWRDRALAQETTREPPFMAPAAERIEAGQLVVVRNDGTVGLALRKAAPAPEGGA